HTAHATCRNTGYIRRPLGLYSTRTLRSQEKSSFLRRKTAASPEKTVPAPTGGHKGPYPTSTPPHMSILVNRDEELQTIEGALDTLLDRKRLLRTPIIEFYGVEGIGKTILLKEVLQRCRGRHLEPIWLDKDKIKNTYAHLPR